MGRKGLQDTVDLKRDLVSLNGLVEQTQAWYANLETRDHKQVPQLASELQQITAGIDSIVREVRDVSDEQLTQAERARLLE